MLCAGHSKLVLMIQRGKVSRRALKKTGRDSRPIGFHKMLRINDD